ncbi:MAG: hypothetical protein JWR21_157, partial [Herminiimonas sp.]|nr:hypothetical protein [Herminiimonas sp.]
VSRSEGMTLGGFKVEIDFLGLFDTVASVGPGNTFGNSKVAKLFDGHYAWADSESMRIPEGINCLHLVSAHEVRRSFPLDSVAIGEMMPKNCLEVVFPGVHSDVGCGYSPGEQGRGVDPGGADMLARVPLAYMYKLARQSGVPLKLELASSTAQDRFRIAPATIKALNAYLGVAMCKGGSLTGIMREQGKNQIQYRLARRAKSTSPLESSNSFLRASTFDQNDLRSSNLEFETEIAAFEAWLSEKGKAFIPKVQKPGFDNEHKNEWEEIATWWKKAPALPVEVLNFFDEYVHDSRASFKLIPGNPDNEADMHEHLQKLVAKREIIRKGNISREKAFLEVQRRRYVLTGKKPNVNSSKYVPPDEGFTEEQARALDEYSRTHKIPQMLTTGREPFEIGWVSPNAGYLRFRKIYAGKDKMLLSDASEFEPDGRTMA